MKTLFFIVIIGPQAWAACPLYQYKDPQLNQEINNTCQQISNPTINNATANSATISSATITNLTVTNISGFTNVVCSSYTLGSTTTSTSLINIEATATIKLASLNSRVFITAVTSSVSSNGIAACSLGAARGGTDLLGTKVAAIMQPIGVGALIPLSYAWIDSPATTGNVTYNMRGADSSGSGSCSYGGSTGSTNLSTLCLQELK